MYTSRRCGEKEHRAGGQVGSSLIESNSLGESNSIKFQTSCQEGVYA
ncbi:MAG: hypothetical protein GY696_08940 [Gammaproteobacteria bacterium]|nr:hypothetical protein [Gammaproteobacteria bacterium]